MGYFSDLDIEFRNEQKNPFIADVLGISYEELLILEYDFYVDKNDEGLIYTYRIEFSRDSPKRILNKIARLEDNGVTVYIQPYELNVTDYYQREFDSFPTTGFHLQKFRAELQNLGQLNLLKLGSETLSNILRRQIFIGTIGAMEIFLSEAFISKTLQDPNLFQNFVETHPEFKKRKFELKDIFLESQRLEITAKQVMLDTIYHNLPVVSQMYSDTFQLPFPQFSDVYENVMKRHDLVHRSGKNKAGSPIKLGKKDIEDLILSITNFVEKVAEIYKIK